MAENKSNNKSKKKLLLGLLALLIAALAIFFGYKYWDKEKQKENYIETIEDYLFKDITELEYKKDKEVYNLMDHHKESFMFEEASKVIEKLYNGEEFLFLLDTKEVEKDAKSFKAFLNNELELEIASSVTSIEKIYKIDEDLYEVISTNYFYSKYDDSKMLNMKFSTIIDTSKRKVKSSKGHIVELISEDENNELITFKQEEVEDYIYDIHDYENETPSEIEVEKGENPQDKTIEEFTKYLNRGKK